MTDTSPAKTATGQWAAALTPLLRKWATSSCLPSSKTPLFRRPIESTFARASQIVLCQNNINQQSHMNRVVTHELIHAFDHCRAHVDWFNNYRHLACSEVNPLVLHYFLLCTEQNSYLFIFLTPSFQIRASNLSGDCDFSSEVARFNFGLKQHRQVPARPHFQQICLVVFFSL